MAIDNCPMGSEWRDWDVWTEERYTLLDEGERGRAERARKAKRGKRLCQIEVAWEAAADDVENQRIPEGTRFQEGSPSHMHAEFKVDDAVVHIDRLFASRWGPGRAYTEFRIFIDGVLAGRGGSCGVSWGVYATNMPAVALIGGDKLVCVDRDSVVTLWEAEEDTEATGKL